MKTDAKQVVLPKNRNPGHIILWSFEYAAFICLSDSNIML